MADGRKPKSISRTSNCDEAWFYVEGGGVDVIVCGVIDPMKGVAVHIPLRSILARIPKGKPNG